MKVKSVSQHISQSQIPSLQGFQSSQSTLTSRGVTPTRSTTSRRTLGSFYEAPKSLVTIKANYKEALQTLQSNASENQLSIQSPRNQSEIPSPSQRVRSTYNSPPPTAQSSRLKNMPLSERRTYIKRMKKIQEDAEVLNHLRDINTFTWRQFQPTQSQLLATQHRSVDLLTNLKIKEKSMQKSRVYRYDDLVAKRLLSDRIEGDRIRIRLGEEYLAKHQRELENDCIELNKKMVTSSQQFVNDMNLYNQVFCSALDYPKDMNTVPAKELKVSKGFLFKSDSSIKLDDQSQQQQQLLSQQQHNQQQKLSVKIHYEGQSALWKRQQLLNSRSSTNLGKQNIFSITERVTSATPESQDAADIANGLKVKKPTLKLSDNLLAKRGSARFSEINAKMQVETDQIRTKINTFQHIFTPIYDTVKKELKSMESDVLPLQNELFSLIRLDKNNNNLSAIVALIENAPNLVHAADSAQCTALHWAAKRNNTLLATTLLKHGAIKTAIDQLGRTPLAIALEAQNFAVKKILQ